MFLAMYKYRKMLVRKKKDYVFTCERIFWQNVVEPGEVRREAKREQFFF